jgi:superkiller protein 3
MQGDRFSAQGEKDKAIAAYESALRIDSDSASIHFKLAQVQQEKGLFSEALASYEQAFAIDPRVNPHPDAIAALKALGDIFQEKSYYTEAISSYEKVLQLDPFDVDAHAGLGKLYLKQEKWDEARRVYEKLIDLDRKNLAAYSALGDIYRQQQDWQQAEAMYEKALKLKPYDAKLSRELGQTYKEQGFPQKAIELYLQAIAVEPKNSELYNLLGEAFYEQKELLKANAAYEQALQLNPRNAKIYKNLCLSQLNQRQYEDALKRCRQAFQLNPELVEARVYAAEIERGLAIRNNPNILTLPEQLPSSARDPLVRVRRSIVKIFARGDSFNGIGTGWIVKRTHNKAWIVTNRHVVTDTKQTFKPATRITVEFFSTPGAGQIRRRQMAEIVQIAPPEDWIDLAVLEVTDPPADLQPFSFAAPSGLVGSPVRVIGNPVSRGDWVLAEGTVNQVNEQQLLMAIRLASGFSGSPVLTARNQVVGLVSQAGLYCPNSPPPTSLESSIQLGCGIAVPIEAVRERLASWGISP